MAPAVSPDDFGEPSLKVAGFQLWVHGWQFPEFRDSYDGNWLQVTAHCGSSGASVRAQGPIIEVTDIESFGKQCSDLLRGKKQSAALQPIEPELGLALDAVDRIGHITVRVEITPDHLSQHHTMEFEIDQSYLPQIIDQCEEILDRYPVRGRVP